MPRCLGPEGKNSATPNVNGPTRPMNMRSTRINLPMGVNCAVMPVLRLTHFANAADVDTVIVDGRVLMQGRVHPHLDEGEILDEAAAEAGAAFSRAGFGPAHRREGTDIWRVSRRDSQPFRPSGDDD